MIVAIQLPGVVAVVPDAVEAADDRSLRSHEGVAQPDGEDCVLLPQRLSGSDLPHFPAPLLRRLV